MIAQEKRQPIYLFSKNWDLRLSYYCFTYASNVYIIQAFKFIDRIKLSDTAINNSNNNQFFSDLETNDQKKK